MPDFIGKPKATLRQPGFSSDFSISKKPSPTLLRDKGNSLGVKSDAEMPPYTLHMTVGSDAFRDVSVQRHVALSASSRYLCFVCKETFGEPRIINIKNACLG